MLRTALIALSALLIGCGIVVLGTGGWPSAFMPLIFGSLLLLGTLWERVRYKPLEPGRPGAGWIATDERFVDDETGKKVRVYLEPATGERRYVED